MCRLLPGDLQTGELSEPVCSPSEPPQQAGALPSSQPVATRARWLWSKQTAVVSISRLAYANAAAARKDKAILGGGVTVACHRISAWCRRPPCHRSINAASATLVAARWSERGERGGRGRSDEPAGSKTGCGVIREARGVVNLPLQLRKAGNTTEKHAPNSVPVE